jgi:hypothetical protein
MQIVHIIWICKFSLCIIIYVNKGVKQTNLFCISIADTEDGQFYNIIFVNFNTVEIKSMSTLFK